MSDSVTAPSKPTPLTDAVLARHEFFAALDLLIAAANGDSGQSHYIRRFLLGLYNGSEWPLDMTILRGIDADLQRAALTVLAVDVIGIREIHEWRPGHRELFAKWWERERP